jgi:hypothetical protein
MVTMGTFPFKEKFPWQNWESNPGPQDQYSETLTTRPRGWSTTMFCGIAVNFSIICAQELNFFIVLSFIPVDLHKQFSLYDVLHSGWWHVFVYDVYIFS